MLRWKFDEGLIEKLNLYNLENLIKNLQSEKYIFI